MENNFILKYYGRLYNPKNWYYNPNYLTDRFYYICGGTAYYKNDIKLKPGHMYLFRSNPSFQVSQDENDPIDHIFFDFVSSMQLIEDEYMEIDIRDCPKLEGIIDSLTKTEELRKIPAKVAESYFNIIMYELRDRLVNNKVYSDLTTRTLLYIHEHDIADISVAGIAEALNININHLIRTFKNETGVTPLKYISLMKSEIAITYMRAGYKMEEIANLLGYSTVSALSVGFKTTTKKNLSEFR